MDVKKLVSISIIHNIVVPFQSPNLFYSETKFFKISIIVKYSQNFHLDSPVEIKIYWSNVTIIGSKSELLKWWVNFDRTINKTLNKSDDILFWQDNV